MSRIRDFLDDEQNFCVNFVNRGYCGSANAKIMIEISKPSGSPIRTLSSCASPIPRPSLTQIAG